MSASQNYYQLLQVREDAPEALIKKAFRKRARECHPDLHPDDPDAEMTFKRLQEAYDVLGDRTKRRQYDQFRALTQSDAGFSFTTNAHIPSEDSSEPSDPNQVYARAVQQASQRQYSLADQSFSKAIAQNPNFVEAYMGRCQVRFVLGDDNGVLEDSSTVISLSPQVAPAHYFQGRARHRLSYFDQAIQAYSKAIDCDQNYASAYFYRGLARSKTKARKGAIADLKNAAQLYRTSGNQRGVRQAESQLKKMRRSVFHAPIELITTFSAYLTRALFDPVGTLYPLFRSLSIGQASQMGLGLAIAAIAAMVFSSSVFWSSSITLPWFQIALLGGIPLIAIVLFSNVSSILARQPIGNWSSDIFVAGCTLVPLGIGSLLSGFHLLLGDRFLWFLGGGMACLTVMILYAGLTQVSRFSEQQATWIVILSALASSLVITWLYPLF